MSNRIEGDLNVGRNIYAGGNLNIPGKATIGHNLIVKGWLEAENIKDANKGLFADSTALNEAYPNPEEGWWALVGDTIPAEIYRADKEENGVVKWESTGVSGGEINVDLTSYVTDVELGDALLNYAKKSELVDFVTDNELDKKLGGYATKDDAQSLSNRVDECFTFISAKDELISQNATAISSLDTYTKGKVGTLETKNTTQDSEINSLKQSVKSVSNSNLSLYDEFYSFKDEVGTKQLNVDNKIVNIETLNATQTNWHVGHGIINLNLFTNIAVFEKNTFCDYMANIPSRFIRNGLFVVFNTSEGWEVWQLLNAEEFTMKESYRKIDWDNSLLENTIKNIQGEVKTLGDRITNEVASLELIDEQINGRLDEVDVAIIAEVDLRKAKDAEQDGKMSDIENQINAQQVMLTDMESTLTNHTDDVATLFAKIEALEAKVLKLEDFHTLDFEPV